jgi:hypothetical protein
MWGKAEEQAGDCARHGLGGGRAHGDAYEHQHKGVAQDHAPDGGALGAQSHADSDFIGAAGNVVGHQAIDADAGQNERENAETGGERCEEALMREGIGDLFGLRAH